MPPAEAAKGAANESWAKPAANALDEEAKKYAALGTVDAANTGQDDGKNPAIGMT